MSYHLPVMARECLDYLQIDPAGTYVDVTFGGGGHSKLILEQLGPDGRLLAFDQDADAEKNLPSDERLLFAAANFRHLKRYLRLYGIKQVDGILADLGVSSHQLDVPERGFSFRFTADLDMRMNQQDGPTAAEILAHTPVDELQYVFGTYGEVRNARTLAQRIGEAREQQAITTVDEFVQIVEPLARGKVNRYLAQVFQALRIAVNDEMRALEEMLEQATTVLRPGGRLVAMSYHSLEDRMVKNVLKTGQVSGEQTKDFYGHIYRPYRLLTKKPVEASAAEVAENPRARSAKLRVGERLESQPPTEN
ncbi:16S rRNA (cytosine(1402)-N(4))-methyltransferase RsmH [Lewinella sp. LCG006]|uniref:16S rRNA (cytosine(1402)-N(4))-methyltransferase RsmH n=1 Tax=Lewinella sp. LCG006 TaxID=3231911 RepID=UPI003460EFDB